MLTLRVTAVHGIAPTTVISATFNEQGGSIGRNPGVTLMLLDEARTISRLQAMIRYIGNQFFYDEQGSNPSLINGVPVGAGKSVPLKHGDILRIAFYTLSVEIPVTPRMPAPSEMSTAHPFAPPPPSPPVSVQTPAATPFFAQPSPPPEETSLHSSPVSVDDPLGLFGSKAPISSSPGQDPYLAAFGAPSPELVAKPQNPSTPDAKFDPVASALFGLPGTSSESTKSDPLSLLSDPMGFSAPIATPSAAPDNKSIPDDFDPFSSGSFDAQVNPVQVDSFREMSFGAPSHDESSIDSLFALGGSSATASAISADPVDAFKDISPDQGLIKGADLSNDPLALFGGPVPAAGLGPAQSNHTPEIHAVFTPPKVMNPAPVPVPHHPQPVEQTQMPAASVQATAAAMPASAPLVEKQTAASSAEKELLLALCEGLGAQLHLPDGLTEEFMYRMGALVRESVQGTIDLLGARAVSKREVKAQATTIMERYNNPLKFAPDVASALPFLLSGKLNPAFLPPISAMRDAHNDLKSHQFGVMAGMRAALEGVLARFTPEQLENRISKKGVLNSVLPATRKAKLWDSYVEMYKDIAQEASDDFQKLFGEAFRQAYEEQVRLLQEAEPEED